MRLEPPDLMETSDFRQQKCFATRAINSSFALPSTGGDLSWASHVPSSLSTSRLVRELGLTFILMIVMLIAPARLTLSHQYMKVLKLLLNAVVAWTLGIAAIAAILYFSNGGSDFTVTDVTGFGVMAIVASGLLMLVLYLPSLYWLKRRRGSVQRRIDFILLTGLLCNLPLIILLLALVNRKMVLSEALGFIVTFLIIGSAFGLGFTLAQQER